MASDTVAGLIARTGEPVGGTNGVAVGMGVLVGHGPAHGVAVALDTTIVPASVAGAASMTPSGSVSDTLLTDIDVAPAPTLVNVSVARSPVPEAPGGGTDPSVTQARSTLPVDGVVWQRTERPVLLRNGPGAALPKTRTVGSKEIVAWNAPTSDALLIERSAVTV